MSKNLVIVESPAKAKTIEKILGEDFHVLASQGHICDITGKGKTSIGIDFNNGYAPHYEIDPKKKHLLEILRKEVEKADTVWLASDEDREGEAIAWHLDQVLGLPTEKRHRITFHEITPTAIKDAIQHPRDIDYNLVNAQQARRVLDRIVGFELSPVLWKKIIPGLSAGRVQSVAVRLIVEREREIEQFVPQASYRLTAVFHTDLGDIRAELSQRFQSQADAESYMSQFSGKLFRISSVGSHPIKRTPAPPFTTSSLQQEAARKLRFSVSKTMRLAQSLYESGHITYMRTDSVNLSSMAIGTTKAEVLKLYGEDYYKTRQYQTRSKGAQEAHEAIRPTYMSTYVAGATEDERRLYELIWKRTLACQMEDAVIEQTRIEIVDSTNAQMVFVTIGEVVSFDGFMRTYVQGQDEQEEQEQTMLPKVDETTSVSLTSALAQETYTKPSVRFNEATLVKKMEELGIGRPSTYAPIIDTIQQRKYVVRGNIEGEKRTLHLSEWKNGTITNKTKQETFGNETAKLLPTDIGLVSNDFLVKSFPDILSYDFTADSEKNFDEIAEGNLAWVEMVDHFYKTFHPMVENLPVGKVQGRELGVEPGTGKLVVAKIGKKGPCIQIGTATDDEKPRFASLEKGQSIETITLEEALKLFETEFPYVLGEYDGHTITISTGKFGPYILFEDSFISIPKTLNPLELKLSDAISLIEEKRQQALPIHEFGDIQVLNGRYGAYIKQGSNNYKLPKGTDAYSLTQEQCEQIIAQSHPTSSKKAAFHRKSSK